MGRKMKLRDLIGAIKDKASLSKAAMFSKPNTISLHLAILRVTTHSPSTPPDDHHLSTLLTLGDSSRATASTIITALMDRLHCTSDSTVALKCLLTIHHIINRGSFILQDQLSIFPSTGGYNYLKMSAFRDSATAGTFALSSWVRWYARYLETLLSASRILGYFVCSSSCSLEKCKLEEKISSFLNVDLIKDVDFLIGLTEELCKVPDNLLIEGNKLLYEVVGLLGNDYLAIVNEVLPRLTELTQRLKFLSFGESIELVCGLNRLEDCKERLLFLFTIQKPSFEMLWSLVDELKIKIGMLKAYNDSGKLLSWGGGGGGRGSESARFADRVLKPADSLLFSSQRFGTDEVSLVVVETK